MKNLKLKEKKINYFDTFIENVNISLEIASILQEYLENFDINISKEIEEKIHKLENDADQNLHETLQFLVKDFLPPIDREDIVLLANRIDDMVDFLDEIAINLNILSINKLRDDVKEFFEIIIQLPNLLKEMLEKFKSKKNYEEIHKCAVVTNNIEEKGDRIYEKAIKNLYKIETNPIEILKWNTIYNTLEDCIDSYENIANTVEEIALKNA